MADGSPSKVWSVLRIRISMFLDLPDPDPLVRGTVPDLKLDPKLLFWIRNTALKNGLHVPVFQTRIRMILMFLSLSNPHPEKLVRGTDPRIWIRIRTKMSRIRNTGYNHISDTSTLNLDPRIGV